MRAPLDKFELPHVGGRFGARRKHDIHTGIDLYCDHDAPVFAIEAGIVIDSGPFTGSKVDTPWWNNTDFIAVAGALGVILYGEIESDLLIGDLVSEGQQIALVKTVLKKNKGLPMCMLHLELYSLDYNGHTFWYLDETQPKTLLDPSSLLRSNET